MGRRRAVAGYAQSSEITVARVGRETKNNNFIFCKLKVTGLDRQQQKRLELATDTGFKKTILNS